MNDNGRRTLKAALRIMAKKAAVRAALLLKLPLAKLLSIALVIALVLFLFVGVAIMGYIIIFEYPRLALEEGMSRVLGAHVDESEEKMAALLQAYGHLSDRWQDGLDPWQKEQAHQYRLPIGVIAATDQVIGGWYAQPGKRESLAEEIYEALKPEFFWREAKTEIAVTYEVDVFDEEGKYLYTAAQTAFHSVSHKDLAEARTFEGRYVYRYKDTTNSYSQLPDTDKYRLTGVSGVVSSYSNVVAVTVTETEPEHIEFAGPYFAPLKALVGRHSINPEDHEFILYLAMAYDVEYEVRAYDLNFDLLVGGYYDPGLVYSGPRGDLFWPSVSRLIVSGFGRRIHPVMGVPHFHGGIDIAGAGINRTPVFAAMNGKVAFAAISGSLTSGYGRLVIISHGDSGFGNETTYYAHLSSIQVKRGDIVRAGDIIGTVGSTGTSTGPHLHFEYRVNNAQKDPLLLYGGMN